MGSAPPLPAAIDANRVLGVVAAVAREARPNVEAYVALDSSLERDLGLDSLARVELVLRLEREFRASLPEQALASSETPRDLLRFLLAPRAAPRRRRSVASGAGRRRARTRRAQTLVEALGTIGLQPIRLTVFLYEGAGAPVHRDLWNGATLYAAPRRAGRGSGRTVAIMLRQGTSSASTGRASRGRSGAALPASAPRHHRGHMTRHVRVLKARRRGDGDDPSEASPRYRCAR